MALGIENISSRQEEPKIADKELSVIFYVR